MPNLMTTRPFKLVNSSESQRLCERMSQGVMRWASEWLSSDEGGSDVTASADVGAIANYRWTARQAAGIDVAVGTSASDKSLRLGLTGNTQQSSVDLDDPLFEELEKLAIRALLDTLFGSADSLDTKFPEPSEYRASGSGYVVLHCRFKDALEFCVLLWPKTVDAWLGQAARKNTRRISVSRLEALDSQTVTLDVVVGEANIAFEELRSLCEGVVIKLNRRVDQPLQVQLVGDGVIGSGHLGLNDGRRAVQVVTTE
jgi:flagellar motor switch/type III secretory pathway protein FliN